MRSLILQATMAWLTVWGAAQAQLLDATVDQELSGVANSKPFIGYYHLWNLTPGLSGPLDSAAWEDVEEAVEAGNDVWIDLEPDVSPNSTWRRPIDPSVTINSMSGIEAVRETHRIIATKLEPLCQRAKITGSRVWTYRVFSHMYTRTEGIANEPSAWERDVAATANLEYVPGKSLAKLVSDTGGGELFQVYVPNGWNNDSFWGLAKTILMLERQYQALEKNGLRGIPLLHFHTIGGAANTNVTETTMKALLFVAKARGRYAIWHGPNPTFNDITSTQKAWIQ
jgi:hypothetical protein